MSGSFVSIVVLIVAAHAGAGADATNQSQRAKTESTPFSTEMYVELFRDSATLVDLV